MKTNNGRVTLNARDSRVTSMRYRVMALFVLLHQALISVSYPLPPWYLQNLISIFYIFEFPNPNQQPSRRSSSKHLFTTNILLGFR